MGTFHVFLFMVIAYTCTAVNGNVYFHATKPTNEWWSNTITYQVYPRSFKDSDNDGIGDLKGITQKLDHFVDLGIETLWIGPLFKSPMDDMGYDVENFYEIDPIFGTMADFDELVLEMKKRDLKLVTDFIPNHSSYKCEWFKKSIEREDKYADYYIWRNASNQNEVLRNSTIKPKPPNNWLSVFGGTAWTWNEERQQFYLHQFTSKQPDFNIRNPNVQKDVLDILAFWMDRGVIGFRIDATKHLYKSDTFLDEPCLKSDFECTINFDSLDHIYTVDQPEIIEIIKEWREFVDNYLRNKNIPFSSYLSTESYSSIAVLMQYYGNSTKPGANVPFNLRLVRNVDKNNIIESIDKIVKDWLDNMPENQVANWAMENHDNLRTPTKYSPEMATLFTAFKLSLPGIEITYYGSEIGMENTYVRSDQSQDPGNMGGNDAHLSRDNGRTPMQWDSSINAVEKEECLWNINNSSYMDKHCKTKAWINVASAVLKNWDTFSNTEQESHVEEIKKKWKNIRDNFARDIKQKNSTPSGSGANPTKKYAYADVLSFLLPVLKKRKTTGNMSSSSIIHDPEIETTVDAGDISEEDYVSPPPSNNNMNTPGPQNKKQKITPFQQNLLHLMQHPPIQSRSEDLDPDKAFLLSFLPEFKKMNDNQKLDFKIAFMQSVKNILNPPIDHSQNFNANIHQFNNYPNNIGQQTSLTHPSPYPIYSQQYLPVRPSSRYSVPQNYGSPTSPPDYNQEDIGMNHSV